MTVQQFGVIGLGVMGKSLALNVERNGFSVAGYEKDKAKAQQVEAEIKDKNMNVYGSLEEFVNSLEKPRKILIMVPAGKAVDAVITDVKPLLTSGDVLIDGGNTYFEDTTRRVKDLKTQGILYVGAGVSGGEEGALWGPSIMPGGNPDAWPLVKPILQKISAKVEDGTPCCDWVGNDGAGHFVKMVHNGIEYGDMQMITEAYFLMEQMLELSPDEMHKIFAEWNKGKLNSYLIEITSDILGKKDFETGKPLVDVILDTAGQKGTGKWTSQVALDLGIPAITIASAVFARTLSAIKEERVAASKILSGPQVKFRGNKQEFIDMIERALYVSKICSYAQGFQLLQAASEEYQMKLNLGNISLLWRAGCIIRAQFLDRIKEAYDRKPDLANLLLDSYFKTVVEENQSAWRHVVATAIEHGIPVPAFSTALSYYDSYRSERLPANLLQAQRDYFGSHTYERIDKPRGKFFHTKWVS
jgi:6-phosphogluconate dehydrogenase